jgi:nicotinamidase-related amidase
MPVTTLDSQSALILIDLQKGIAAYPTLVPLSEIARHARSLADAFRGRQLPVVLVNALGRAPGRTEQIRKVGEFPADFAEFLPELNQQPEDHVVSKRTPGAFTNTGLEGYLKEAGVTQVVIAGASTSNGVESTARQAYELGFNVTLALDAMTDTDAEAHLNSTTRIFPKLGETGPTAAIVELLAR